ncbi:hypothetical protein EBT25_18095 [bacterium]|jgi:hypothetical protein|nr:hypothetical protein [bacterium]
MIPGDSYLVLLRYWVGDKTVQKQAIVKTPEKANKMAQNAYNFCVSNKHDYFIEVLPKFGQPVVYGSAIGLDRYKGLF